MANAERCVCCGEIIPEGRMVCPNCEVGSKGKEKQTIPLRRRIIYAGDVFNSLMAEKRWSVTEASEFMRAFREADAVEVVRCRDCKGWCPEEIAKAYNVPRYCTLTGIPTDADDFCSYGGRKYK